MKLGLSSSSWARDGPASSAVDLSSFAASSVLKSREVVDLAKHYGRCYWELSKARLRLSIVLVVLNLYVLVVPNP